MRCTAHPDQDGGCRRARRTMGTEQVEEALGLTAVAGHFDDGDLASILDHLARGRPGLERTGVRAMSPISEDLPSLSF